MSSIISLMSNEGSKICEGHTVEAGWRVHYKRVGTISHKGSFPGVNLGVWEVSTAHWLTIFLVASFDVQVHITSEGIVRRIECGYLCQKWAGILGVRMEEQAIEAKNNTLQMLVSPECFGRMRTLELGTHMYCYKQQRSYEEVFDAV
jgi:hypothetical protein